MASIQFGGVVSGLNTQSIIDAMVSAEKVPLTDLQNQQTVLQSQQTAYTTLGTSMDAVITALQNFTVTNAGAGRAATSSDDSILTATAGTSAAVGSYQISVNHLATSTTAMSTGSMGAAVTGGVNTALTLATANLATPITAGNMDMTVDGTTVQVAVGNPATTTIQNVIDGVTSALQAQLQTTDPTSTVSGAIVNGQLQLTIAGNTASHDISFGDSGDTSNVATALGLGTQGVTGFQNGTITGTTYLDPTIASLNLPGTVTAGQISAIVDGTIVHYTVGDPTTTTLDQFMSGFGQAIQSQLRAGGSDPAATVNISAAGNRLQIAVTGSTAPHSISFGAASDVSNALGMLGIANSTATNATNPTLTGTTNLGVTRMSSALDTAGLTGLTSTATGTLTINGVAVAYNTTSDSLTDVITAINNSAAGVTASVDRTNDQILLTRKDTGAVAIDISDTGTLASALKLAPGTTNAQTIGQNAQVTVDGRSFTSASNTVTNAIDGVVLSLTGQSATGETQTLTIGIDQSGIQSSLQQFVSAFNAMGDTLDSLTAKTPGTTGGTAGTASPLSDDPTATTMFLDLRNMVLQAVGTGNINSLGSLGINTGAVGAAVGTTTRLHLDTTTLSAALTSDPTAASNLLDSTTGPLGLLLTRLQGYEDPSSTQTYVQAATASITSQMSDITAREATEQEMIDNYTAMIEAQFTAMETTLATLQSQSAQLNAELGISTTSSSSSTSATSGLSQASTGS